MLHFQHLQAKYTKRAYSNSDRTLLQDKFHERLRTMCGSRTGGWLLPGVMCD
jgi:hypothetical protein